MSRRGDWCQTFTGGQFWPLDSRASEVRIEDIAHALSLVCRFGGHCKRFYSVAQHSFLVSTIVPPVDALVGLLHDAAEAYVGDMVRPLKRSMPNYVAVEIAICQAIAERFGLSCGGALPASVRHADEVLLATEARDIMGGRSSERWILNASPLELRIDPWDPETAERAFLDRFALLTGAAS